MGGKGTMVAPLLQPPELSPEQAHTFHERAAILEFDGKLPREMAEALALAEVKGKRNEKKSAALAEAT